MVFQPHRPSAFLLKGVEGRSQNTGPVPLPWKALSVQAVVILES